MIVEPQKLEAFPAQIHQLSLAGVQSQLQLAHDPPNRLQCSLCFRLTSADDHKVSSPGESHPEALAELYVSLSTHTAPSMEPRRTPMCQWANSSGARREIRAIQCVARRRWWRSFLYLRLAQRARSRSSSRIAFAALLETAGLKWMKNFPLRFFALRG